MSLIVYTLLLLGVLGFMGALVLYATSKKFRVEEDPRVEAICDLLPGANCGGCGRKGCRDFANECASRGDLNGIYCPVGGDACMSKIADILGIQSSGHSRQIATLKCNGSCTARPERYLYDGAESCAVMDGVGVGTRGCAYGCLGCGDCIDVCRFDAIKMDGSTMLPRVDADACTACGACVKACPRNLIELRPEGVRRRRVWVACSSRDRGAVARRTCAAACIGCGKCERTCPFGAITVTDNLAYINPELCRNCGKCIGQCPTGAILATFEAPNSSIKQQ